MKTQLRKWLTSQGIYWDNHPATPQSNEGAPDLYCILDGHFVGIEGKTYTGRQRVRQMAIQKHIEDSGGEYWIIHSLDELKQRIEEFRGHEYTTLRKVLPGYAVQLDTDPLDRSAMLCVRDTDEDGHTYQYTNLNLHDIHNLELWCRYAKRTLEGCV